MIVIGGIISLVLGGFFIYGSNTEAGIAIPPLVYGIGFVLIGLLFVVGGIMFRGDGDD